MDERVAMNNADCAKTKMKANFMLKNTEKIAKNKGFEAFFSTQIEFLRSLNEKLAMSSEQRKALS